MISDEPSQIGAHVEGPFINEEKKGAHDKLHIRQKVEGLQTLLETYGNLDNVALITVAPELPGIMEVIPTLVEKNIKVSIGN